MVSELPGVIGPSNLTASSGTCSRLEMAIVNEFGRELPINKYTGSCENATVDSPPPLPQTYYIFSTTQFVCVLDQNSRLKSSHEFHFEELSNFSLSIEELVQIQDIDLRI